MGPKHVEVAGPLAGQVDLLGSSVFEVLGAAAVEDLRDHTGNRRSWRTRRGRTRGGWGAWCKEHREGGRGGEEKVQGGDSRAGLASRENRGSEGCC